MFGPQTAYFAPQILMEQDVHAPGIDARGAAFPGVNLYVQLGRGRDYAWSATSAGQDIIDTFAVDLCDPDGSPPTKASDALPVPRPVRADGGPAARRTAGARRWPTRRRPAPRRSSRRRTKLGLVRSRATLRGKPVAYTELRSTYLHEIDSARGFSDFNDPDKMRDAADFQRAAAKIGYTFNWLYADDRDIAYFNSGNNPLRPPGVDPLLPTRAQLRVARLRPGRQHRRSTRRSPRTRRSINQPYLTSWNNKQARGYGADNSGFYSGATAQTARRRDREAASPGRRR